MKKLSKLIAYVTDKSRVKVTLSAMGILVILVIWGVWQEKNIGEAIFDILISQDAFSFLSAFLITVIIAKGFSRFEKYSEESFKTEDNHHKIIEQYKEHKIGQTQYNNSFIKKKGEYLLLTHVPTKKNKKSNENDSNAINKAKENKVVENKAEDNESPKKIKMSTTIKNKYNEGELCLASLNVFANISGDTEISFKDSNRKQELPTFVINNADEILQAHKNSIKNNSTTVRLDDFDYNNNVLELTTSRSTYYNMLVTNRCMDYKFANGLSIREVYEYDNKICPIEYSKLGNQIGINGLIITSDDYILVEKRGHNKSTWKNKFAQSISLALKLNDLKLDRREVLDNSTVTAQEKLKNIISETIYKNFGLTHEDYETFTIKQNFLGLARDLLEGGKPNLYFYVRTKTSAAELKKTLEDQVLSKKEGEYVIKDSKLESDYYLIPRSQVNVDFDYKMALLRKNILKVHRRVSSRCGRMVGCWEKIKEIKDNIFNPKFVRECGEALLVTLAYMELCWDRIEKIKTVKMQKESKTILSFGEIMLRLTPTNSILNSDEYNACFGGTESNVLVALSGLGNSTRYLTKLPDNSLGRAALEHLKKYEIDCDSIISQGNNMGLYFLEKGNATRNVIYSRKHSEVTTLNVGDFNFDTVFENVNLFHITGISFALSPTSQKLCFAFLAEAKKRNIPISFDFNYRAKLWSVEEAAIVYKKIIPFVDIVFCSSKDLNVFLDIRRNDFFNVYGDKLLVVREREIVSPDEHIIKSEVYTKDGKKVGCEKEARILELIGGGDAFAAGFIHGYLNFDGDIKKILDFATNCFVIKATVEGDVLYMSEKRINSYFESSLKGGNEDENLS